MAQGANQAAIARTNQVGFVQDGIRQGFATPWEDLLAEMVLGGRDFVEKQSIAAFAAPVPATMGSSVEILPRHLGLSRSLDERISSPFT